MSSARVDYIAPWWTYWLHNFPHINLRFQPIDNNFQPEDENYQQVSEGKMGRGLHQDPGTQSYRALDAILYYSRS